MTAVGWAALIGAIWTLLAFGLGILIGRVIRRADEIEGTTDRDEDDAP